MTLPAGVYSASPDTTGWISFIQKKSSAKSEVGTTQQQQNYTRARVRKKEMCGTAVAEVTPINNTMPSTDLLTEINQMKVMHTVTWLHYRGSEKHRRCYSSFVSVARVSA